MDEKWWQSRRWWAGILAVAGTILTLVGYTGFDPTAQTALLDAVTVAVKDITALLVPILAIWSWFKPKKTTP